MFIFALIWLNFSCFSFIICRYDYFWLCFNLCPVLLQSILFWLLCCFNLVFFVCFCVLCMHLWVFCARNVWVLFQNTGLHLLRLLVGGIFVSVQFSFIWFLPSTKLVLEFMSQVVHLFITKADC